MKKRLALLFAVGFAAAGISWSAQAMPSMPTTIGASDVVKAGFICGPGYHLGPYGHYCWPNKVMHVPPHWHKECPPGFHLGPERKQCWPD